jgi:hypothetical protein
MVPLRWPRVRWAAGFVLAVALAWQTPVRPAVGALAASLHERAAFIWEERFDSLANWLNASALEPDPAVGAVRVQGLALHSRTMTLRNYEVNFEARIQKKAIGWVVRGAGRDSFYAFKLTDRGPRAKGGPRLELSRYRLIAGEPSPVVETVPVAFRVPEDGFLDITVRVTEDQILTSINGYGIDAWKLPKLKTSGVGLLAEKGESFLVRSLTISGNEDLLGRFLSGAEETIRLVRRNLTTSKVG